MHSSSLYRLKLATRHWPNESLNLKVDWHWLSKVLARSPKRKDLLSQQLHKHPLIKKATKAAGVNAAKLSKDVMIGKRMKWLWIVNGTRRRDTRLTCEH